MDFFYFSIFFKFFKCVGEVKSYFMDLVGFLDVLFCKLVNSRFKFLEEIGYVVDSRYI